MEPDEQTRSAWPASTNLSDDTTGTGVQDPAALVSAGELGRALGGLSDETVRQRERAGELFSILRPAHKREAEYPAFQAWAGVAGAPLANVLRELGRPTGTAAYGFFSSPNDLLGGLSPTECMVGHLTSKRELESEALEFLAKPAEVRQAAVLKAAGACAADLSA